MTTALPVHHRAGAVPDPPAAEFTQSVALDRGTIRRSLPVEGSPVALLELLLTAIKARPIIDTLGPLARLARTPGSRLALAW
jgi:hypothetical protein